MNATLYPAAAAFAWAVVLGNLRRLLAMRGQPARLAAWTSYLFFALIFTTGSAAVWDRLDTWTGLPESNTLIAMCMVVCYSTSALTLLQLWSYTADRARRRVRITVSAAVLVLTAMIALFVRSDTSHQHQQSFTAWYGGSVEYDVYLLIYLAAYTTVEIEVIRLCRRYAAMITRSWLRAGLIITSVGAAIGLLYTFIRLADIITALVGFDISPMEDVAEAGAGLGALLVMLGLTLHHWGPRISTVARRTHRLIACARLRPLWATFYTLDPSIAFDDHRIGTGQSPSRTYAARLALKDPEYYVTRRVVEIRDGILSLRPYQTPDFTGRARTFFESQGLSGDDLDAAVTAVQIHAALNTRGTVPQSSQPSLPAAGNAPADLDAELAWLLKVTRYFTRKPSALSCLTTPDPMPTGGAS